MARHEPYPGPCDKHQHHRADGGRDYTKFKRVTVGCCGTEVVVFKRFEKVIDKGYHHKGGEVGKQNKEGNKPSQPGSERGGRGPFEHGPIKLAGLVHSL